MEFTEVICIKDAEHKEYNIFKDNLYYIKTSDVKFIKMENARNYFYTYVKNESGYKYIGLIHRTSVILKNTC